MLWIGRILGCCGALGSETSERDITLSPMVRIAGTHKDALDSVLFKHYKTPKMQYEFRI